MTIADIRKANLRRWFSNRPIPPKEKSYLSQLMSDTTRASFGERAARRLEKDYGMGDGYLDRETEESQAVAPLLRFSMEAETDTVPNASAGEILAALDKAIHEMVCVNGAFCTDRPDLIERKDLFFEADFDVEIDRLTQLMARIADQVEAVIVPRLSVVGSMGPGELQPDRDTLTGALRLSERWVRDNLKSISSHSNLAIISGYGDSMEPTFHDGDMLLVDTGICSADVDGVYVMSANNRLYIKRVRQRMDGRFEVSSDNPTVKTVDVLNGEQQVTIHGRVVWSWNGKRM